MYNNGLAAQLVQVLGGERDPLLGDYGDRAFHDRQVEYGCLMSSYNFIKAHWDKFVVFFAGGFLLNGIIYSLVSNIPNGATVLSSVAGDIALGLIFIVGAVLAVYAVYWKLANTKLGRHVSNLEGAQLSSVRFGVLGGAIVGMIGASELSALVLPTYASPLTTVLHNIFFTGALAVIGAVVVAFLAYYACLMVQKLNRCFQERNGNAEEHRIINQPGVI